MGNDFHACESLVNFKNKVNSLLRPDHESIFDIHDTKGIKCTFQLRVGLSPLKAHKNSHNFNDTPADRCECKSSAENRSPVLFHCSLFRVERL